VVLKRALKERMLNVEILVATKAVDQPDFERLANIIDQADNGHSQPCGISNFDLLDQG
jgi:hypothetical protein